MASEGNRPNRSGERWVVKIARRPDIAVSNRWLLRLGALLGPVSLAFLLHFLRNRIRADELRGFLKHLEHRNEILAEDIQACLADFIGLLVALAFGKDEEMVAISCALDLGRV